MKNVKRAPLPELTEKEIQLKMFKIGKEDNLSLKSMKDNLQFIAWYLIITIIIGFIGVIVFIATS